MDLTEPLARRAAAHACAYLAAIGDRPVRAMLTGDDLRARLGGPLQAGGEDPIQVLDAIADAGLTGTVAAADPILAIAPLTRERGAWLHVDGAFGLWAAASPSLRHMNWSTTAGDIDRSAAAILAAL